MDRLPTDYTRDSLPTNENLLANQMTDINSTNYLKTIDTVTIISNDHKADFVHVCIGHHTRTLLSPPKLGRQYIAQRIYLDLIRVRLDLLQNDLADLSLIA